MWILNFMLINIKTNKFILTQIFHTLVSIGTEIFCFLNQIEMAYDTKLTLLSQDHMQHKEKKIFIK